MKTKISIICALFMSVGILLGQNRTSEVMDYREVDNKIILELYVNGVKADFVLDLAGHTAVLPEYVEKLKIDPSQKGEFGYDGFQYKPVKTTGTVRIGTVSMGNNAYATEVPAFILEDEPYLRELGVAGVVNASLFQQCILTIDARRKKITTSTPYRPNYIKTNMREDMQLMPGVAVKTPITVNGKTVEVLLDTWHDGMLVLTPDDFSSLNLRQNDAGTLMPEERGYCKTGIGAASALINDLRFIKSDLTNIIAVEDNNIKSYSVLGNGILKEGLVSIDYGRLKIYFQPFDLVAVEDENITYMVENIPGKLNEITKDYFIKYIYDYKNEAEFHFKGDKPVVIDFWATWCGPCMKMMPAMEVLAEKYKDQVLFLKVNADIEKELCSVFNITALPTVFFIPVSGRPVIEIGSTPEKYELLIKELLLQ